MSELNQDDPYYTPKKAAEYLGSSTSTLAKRRMKPVREPAFFRIGRAVRYRKRDLDAWLASSANSTDWERVGK